jgi:hypothetical protein
MPTVSVDIESVEQTVTRPVVTGIVYDLVSAMGLPNNTRIIYPGSQDEEDLKVVAVDNGNNRIYGKDLKILLEVNELIVDERVTSTRININENKPIFEDSAIGVKIAPIYSHTELEITLKMRFPNKTAAEKQRSDMRRNASLFRESVMHEIEYNYLIPKVNLVILAEIHRCRERQVGYGDTFQDWLTEHFVDEVVPFANQINSQRSLSKKEIQTRVQGTWDFDIVPEKGDDSDNRASHILTFTYKVRYDKILSTMMKYPILVHNVAISPQMYDRSIPYELGMRLQMPSQATWALDTFTGNNYVTGFIDGAPIPLFHDWLPTDRPTGVVGLLRVMIQVQPQDRFALFNLRELGDLEIKPELLDYMQSEHEYLSYHGQSAVFISLYENGNIRDGDQIRVDEDLNITTTFSMDLRKTYNVWVTLLADLRLLSSAAFERLRARGVLAQAILNAIDPSLGQRRLIPDTMVNGALPTIGMKKAVQSIVSRKNPILGTAEYSQFRIGQFVIVAERMYK